MLEITCGKCRSRMIFLNYCTGHRFYYCTSCGTEIEIKELNDCLKAIGVYTKLKGESD